MCETVNITLSKRKNYEVVCRVRKSIFNGQQKVLEGNESNMHSSFL